MKVVYFNRKTSLLQLFITFLVLFSSLKAQKRWSLDSCITYALHNNLTILISGLQEVSQEDKYNQSKANLLPTLNLTTSLGAQFGRSIDPTTNNYTSTQVLFNSLGVQSSITLFNWFSTKNNIKLNKKNLELASLETEKLKSNLRLNITAGYLQLLEAIKQQEIIKNRIDLTSNQLKIISAMIEAGKKPESDRLQLISQLSADSVSFYSQGLLVEKAKLQMKLIMHIDMQDSFEVPSEESVIPEEFPILENPEIIYAAALQYQPLQKENKVKTEVLQLQKEIQKAAFYPTLSGNMGISSNYSNLYSDFSGKRYPYFTQVFDINMHQFLGLSLSIPVLNNKKGYYAYKETQTALKRMLLQTALDNQQLKQSIYSAYQTAKTNLSIYANQLKNASATQSAFTVSQKRFEAGKSGINDYLLSVNTLFLAQANKTAAYFNYLFSVKILNEYSHCIICN